MFKTIIFALLASAPTFVFATPIYLVCNYPKTPEKQIALITIDEAKAEAVYQLTFSSLHKVKTLTGKALFSRLDVSIRLLEDVGHEVAQVHMVCIERSTLEITENILSKDIPSSQPKLTKGFCQVATPQPVGKL